MSRVPPGLKSMQGTTVNPKRTDIPVDLLREHFRAMAKQKVASG